MQKLQTPTPRKQKGVSAPFRIVKLDAKKAPKATTSSFLPCN